MPVFQRGYFWWHHLFVTWETNFTISLFCKNIFLLHLHVLSNIFRLHFSLFSETYSVCICMFWRTDCNWVCWPCPLLLYGASPGFPTGNDIRVKLYPTPYVSNLHFFQSNIYLTFLNQSTKLNQIRFEMWTQYYAFVLHFYSLIIVQIQHNLFSSINFLLSRSIAEKCTFMGRGNKEVKRQNISSS